MVEQQSAPAVQDEPTALQPPLPGIAAQLLPGPPSVEKPAQLRVQQSAPEVQVVPMFLHWVLEQLPAVQTLVQHSVEVAQLAPAPLQKLCWVHRPLALQKPEQH